jgi:hypothetical protein
MARAKQTSRKVVPKLPPKLLLAKPKEIIPTKDALSNLPKKILNCIFGYLNCKQLYSIRRVCFDWKNFLESNQQLFKYHFQKKYPNREKPDIKSWSQYYVHCLEESVRASINCSSIVHSGTKTGSISSVMFIFVEQKTPIEKGIYQLLLRSGALLVDKDVYGM